VGGCSTQTGIVHAPAFCQVNKGPESYDFTAKR
jgi:hypothetical protein